MFYKLSGVLPPSDDEPVPKEPDGFCGHKATLKQSLTTLGDRHRKKSELCRATGKSGAGIAHLSSKIGSVARSRN